jgi:hypothetical protein
VFLKTGYIDGRLGYEGLHDLVNKVLNANVQSGLFLSDQAPRCQSIVARWSVTGSSIPIALIAFIVSVNTRACCYAFVGSWEFLAFSRKRQLAPVLLVLLGVSGQFPLKPWIP